MKTKKIVVICCILFAIPLFIYVCYFPGGITHEHTRWSEFGSFIGGVVTSIFSFGSFLLLIIERMESKKIIEDEKEKNKAKDVKTIQEEKIKDLLNVANIIAIKLDDYHRYYKQHIQSLAKENLDSYPEFSEIIFHLNYFRSVLTEISEINGQMNIIEFYRKKYQKLTTDLFNRKLIEYSEL